MPTSLSVSQISLCLSFMKYISLFFSKLFCSTPSQSHCDVTECSWTAVAMCLSKMLQPTSSKNGKKCQLEVIRSDFVLQEAVNSRLAVFFNRDFLSFSLICLLEVGLYIYIYIYHIRMVSCRQSHLLLINHVGVPQRSLPLWADSPYSN